VGGAASRRCPKGLLYLFNVPVIQLDLDRPAKPAQFHAHRATARIKRYKLADKVHKRAALDLDCLAERPGVRVIGDGDYVG